MSANWYRDIVGFAYDMPGWVRDLGGFLTENLLFAFAILFVVGFWRARRIGPVAMTLAASIPVAMVAAYAVSEGLKSVIREDRPCRAVPDIQQTVLDCPEITDWSFPSNHSTLAASGAVALVIAWRRTAVLAALLALLEAFSRVFVGVHYPHDVLAGLLLGSIVAALVLWIVRRIVAPRIERAVRQRWTDTPPLPDDATRPIAAVPPERVPGPPQG